MFKIRISRWSLEIRKSRTYEYITLLPSLQSLVVHTHLNTLFTHSDIGRPLRAKGFVARLDTLQ